MFQLHVITNKKVKEWNVKRKVLKVLPKLILFSSSSYIFLLLSNLMSVTWYSIRFFKRIYTPYDFFTFQFWNKKLFRELSKPSLNSVFFLYTFFQIMWFFLVFWKQSLFSTINFLLFLLEEKNFKISNFWRMQITYQAKHTSTFRRSLTRIFWLQNLFTNIY